MRKIVFVLALLLPVLVPAEDIRSLLHIELASLTGGGPAAPADFLGEDLLCLVLWDSQCPDCLENVAQLGTATPPAGVTLLGVNFDSSPWEAEDFLDARRPAFPQLHDSEARLALALGADGYSFSFALLGPEGDLLARQLDSVEDASLTLRRAVEALRRQPETVGAESLPRIPRPEAAVVHVERRYPVIRSSGRARMRALSVSVWGDQPAEGCGATGPYGESLAIQKNLLYRLSYELVAEMGPGLSAGGKLRVSNEDPALFTQGPQYLTSEIGSVFAELHRGRLAARMGYFTEHYTPLTLQRWDFADNPPAAGSGGSVCGVCGGSLRGISLEALDDLGPGITFEGLRLETSLMRGLRLSGFYAIPQRAAASNEMPDDNPFAYRLDLLGSRLRYNFGLFGGSGGELALQHLSAHEDGESSRLDEIWANFPFSFIHKREVWSVALKSPLSGGLGLEGETAKSFERVDRLDAKGESVVGEAHTLGLVYKRGKRVQAGAAWQRLGPRFRSPYQALSYRSNAEGFRVSADWRGEGLSLSVFHKRLEGIEEIAGEDDPERMTVSSALLGWRPTKSLFLDLVTTLTSEEYDEEKGTCNRLNTTLSARHELSAGMVLQADLSILRAESEGAGDPQRSMIATLQVTADFD